MRRTAFRRAKKSERQKLIAANDRLFREIIRIRDRVCQKTGKTTNLQVCHFYTRSILRVRWLGDNACLLNGGIHLFWGHKNPQEFREFWLRRLGQKKFDELELRAKYVAPVHEIDLRFINFGLTNQLEELKKRRKNETDYCQNPRGI